MTLYELLDDLDMGECCGLADPGSALNDYKDQIQCENEAEVALFEGEHRGLVLCSKCYKKHPASVDAGVEPEPPAC